MFPGPAQRKQIDNIGQIFSGFLSTCFLGPNPSNIWMFEKWKQHCCQVFLRAFFWWDLRKTNQNSCIMSPNFPWPALQKKLYIYILYILYIYIILYYILYYIYIYIILYYIYICSIFLPQIFPRPAVQKNKHICSIFPQPALPSQPKKTNKHTFCSFFCHRFARGQPSKKYKFEKHTTYIFVSVFFATDFPATSPPRNISFKK